MKIIKRPKVKKPNHIHEMTETNSGYNGYCKKCGKSCP